MICNHCGLENEVDSKFCIHCGKLVFDETEAINPSPQEEEIHKVSDKRRLSKWWYIGIGSALLISAIIVIFSLLPSAASNPLSEKNAEVNVPSGTPDASAEPAGSASPLSNEIQPFKISTINPSLYPMIGLVIEAEDIESLDLSPQNFTVTENGVTQKVVKVDSVESGQITVSYETTVVNISHDSPEPRNIQLQYLKQTTSAHYEAPKPQTLSIGDFSYNTDQYPQVKLYFSLYDSNNQLVENLPTDSSFFQLQEDKKQLKTWKFSKMSEIKESLSTNVVIDVSTSMEGIMEVVKNQALQFVSQSALSGSDQMALMSFAGATEITQNDFTNDKNSIHSQISQLSSYGECTALYRSMEQAVYNTAYNGAEGSKYVVIFTDGGENCSNDVSNQSAVSAGTVINTSLQLGVPIYAVGVQQDDELQRIAKESNGDYISIGSDIDKLGGFYSSIYSRKKAQYVATYTSSNPKKTLRNTSIVVNSPTYFATLEQSVTPKLLDDPDVATAMEMYQINWSAAMSSGDISYLSPYVTVNSQSANSVYNIVLNQVNSINEAKNTGSYFEFDVPIYRLEDALKVTPEHYQLKLKKRFKRTVYENGSIENTAFKETAYTYNVVKQDNSWLVDSTVESKVPEICYVDDTYLTKKKCN
ncbi:VWA domain-containing protein [Paenibacillus wynnii]|uniref:VWA domain-containing protein n=1 Tax=Paenibacillus wynnii TaxID=268407 RepID=UPI002791E9B0|nr:VWA domain-containing protein [Paenibacillus wynnii]MDQ0194136.1 Mg-chelatase subunit ChlD [Paenibacillus wynnii]